MPVGHFSKPAEGDAFCFVTVLFKGQSFLIGRNTASPNVGDARDAPFSLKVDYTVQILGFLQMQMLLPLRNVFRSGNAVSIRH